MFKKGKNSLDVEREEKLNVQKLENYFNDVLPILQTNLFVSLIEEELMKGNIQNLWIPIKLILGGHIIVVRFSIHLPIMFLKIWNHCYCLCLLKGK